MSEELSNAFAQQLRSMAEFTAEGAQWPSPEYAFTLYAYKSIGADPPDGVCPQEVSASEISRMDQAPVLASVGYLMALTTNRSEMSAADWSSCFSRLSTRSAFPADRESFFFRPLELLGITLGAVSCPGVKSTDVDWLRQVIKSGEERQRSGGLWSLLLGAYSAHLLNSSWSRSALPPLTSMSSDDMALILWLNAISPRFAKDQGIADSSKDVESSFLNTCALRPIQRVNTAQAALLHISLTSLVSRVLRSEHEQNWQIGRNRTDALLLVRMICRRFHLCARQLAVRQRGRQPITMLDEYDVQDLMHALLLLHFDDVRTEEWTPSYAGGSARMDFLLKREHIVIETKMTRNNLHERRVGEELIIDKEHYRKAHSDCEALVCFVYDPMHKCTNPAGLEHDLSEIESGSYVEVIVEPR